MLKLKFFVFCILFFENSAFLENEVMLAIDKVLNYMDKYHMDLNIDAIFGLTLAEAHLELAHTHSRNIRQKKHINSFLKKCDVIKIKTLPNLPTTPKKMILFQNIMLNSPNWKHHLKPFKQGQIQNLGLYTNWTSTDILKNREASYKGVPTDVCLEELLSNSKKYCFVSPLCKQMMLGIRNDTGYLLTHRLLYMQLLQLIDCQIPNISIEGYIRGFCSLIYKELKTSAHLNYPYHDKFLEQILLCGQEGFAEILKPHWLSEILTWQQPQGCFKSITSTRMTRSSNVIAFGCSDHSTGLGSGVLALYLRFLSV